MTRSRVALDSPKSYRSGIRKECLESSFVIISLYIVLGTTFSDIVSTRFSPNVSRLRFVVTVTPLTMQMEKKDRPNLVARCVLGMRPRKLSL